MANSRGLVQKLLCKPLLRYGELLRPLCVPHASNGSIERQGSGTAAAKRAQEPLAFDEVTIYRWPTMKHFRFISKFKVYQVSFMLALLPPSLHWYATGALTTWGLACGGVALAGTTSVLMVVSHYFSKLVGEMRFDTRRDVLRISTLTFWGNRREVELPAHKIVMFVESQTRMGGAFQHLEVTGHGETFLWSLRYGRVLDFDLLRKVLKISDTDLSHF